MKKPSNNEDIMTAEELAKYLGIHRGTVYRKARNKQLPGFKPGGRGEWRFKKSIIDEWIKDESLKNLRENGGN